MKKKFIISATLAVALMAVCGFMKGQNHEAGNGLNPMQMATIDALSRYEDIGPCRWFPARDSSGCPIHVCVSNGNGDQCRCGDMKHN